MKSAMLVLFALACDARPTGSEKPAATGGGSDGESGTPPDSAEPPDPRLALQIAAPAGAHTDHGATPDVCAECHENADGASAMRLADGTGVAPYDLQHASVMANAGRDPVFYAVLAAESARVDAGPAAVESICFRCHAPMAVAEARETGAELVDAATLRGGDGTAETLGREGVSCVSCHRMADDGLETPERWTGRFLLDDAGQVFGPHAEPFSHPMEMHTGWTPTESDHVTDSRLCASCHTLQTHTVVDGEVTENTFLEQATWLEWRASGYAAEGEGGASCQDCHLPTTEPDGSAIHTRIARRPDGNDFPQVDARSPYGLHDQVGGNTLLLSLLRDHADVLQPRAGAEALDRTLAATRDMLGTAVAVRIEGATRTDGGLEAVVAVDNRTGHKLPTGYPSRRAWLRVEVHDADGALVYAAGTVDGEGRLLDAAGAPLPSEAPGGPAPNHVEEVGAEGIVPVYGVTMLDAAGAPTWRLLPAATMGRDTRLLPAGWDPSAAETEVGSIAPVGVDDDTDFVAGGDRVRISLPAVSGSAPHTLTVGLLYQPLSARFAAELSAEALPESIALDAMLDTTGLQTEVLAEATADVP
jgi:hypothetical protein